MNITPQKKGSAPPSLINNVQTKYLKQAVVDNTTLLFTLSDNTKIVGTVVSFDLYTILVSHGTTTSLLYKTYIKTVTSV